MNRGRIQLPDRPCIDGLQHSAMRLDWLAAPRKLGFWLIGYVFAITIMGSSLPAPLYVIYEHQWHVAPEIVTFIYAVAAAAVLCTLLLAGQASDQAGRRPVMAVAVALSMGSAAVFTLATSATWLYFARFLSGLASGLITGAATAALTETIRPEDARRASLVAATANLGGAGLGPLHSGLLADFTPRPTVLPFEVYLILLATAALALAFAPETVPRREKLRLGFTGLGVPRHGRNEFLAAGMGVFAAYALIGLFTSLTPAFADNILHRDDFAISGGISSLLFATACVAAVGLAWFNSRPVMLIGLGLLMAGLPFIVVGLAVQSLGLFVGGALVDGAAVGAIVVSSLSITNRLSSPQTRARVISTYFVFAFSGLIVPVIGIGIAAQYEGDFRAVFGCSVLLVAMAAFAVVLTRGGGRASRPLGPAARRLPLVRR
jgi:MFS family permease